MNQTLGSTENSPGNLSPAEIDELREAFQVFDKDDSGSITSAELYLMLTTVFPLADVTEDDVDRIVMKFDFDGDGTIDFNEFMHMMTHVENRVEAKDEIHDAFKIFDRDGDGTITCREIMNVINKLGEPIDEKTVNLMIQSVDLDGNGTIDVFEFRKMMRDDLDINQVVNLNFSDKSNSETSNPDSTPDAGSLDGSDKKEEGGEQIKTESVLSFPLTLADSEEVLSDTEGDDGNHVEDILDLNTSEIVQLHTIHANANIPNSTTESASLSYVSGGVTDVNKHDYNSPDLDKITPQDHVSRVLQTLADLRRVMYIDYATNTSDSSADHIAIIHSDGKTAAIPPPTLNLNQPAIMNQPIYYEGALTHAIQGVTIFPPEDLTTLMLGHDSTDRKTTLTTVTVDMTIPPVDLQNADPSHMISYTSHTLPKTNPHTEVERDMYQISTIVSSDLAPYQEAVKHDSDFVVQKEIKETDDKKNEQINEMYHFDYDECFPLTIESDDEHEDGCEDSTLSEEDIAPVQINADGTLAICGSETSPAEMEKHMQAKEDQKKLVVKRAARRAYKLQKEMERRDKERLLMGRHKLRLEILARGERIPDDLVDTQHEHIERIECLERHIQIAKKKVEKEKMERERGILTKEAQEMERVRLHLQKDAELTSLRDYSVDPFLLNEEGYYLHNQSVVEEIYYQASLPNVGPCIFLGTEVPTTDDFLDLERDHGAIVWTASNNYSSGRIIPHHVYAKSNAAMKAKKRQETLNRQKRNHANEKFDNDLINSQNDLSPNEDEDDDDDFDSTNFDEILAKKQFIPYVEGQDPQIDASQRKFNKYFEEELFVEEDWEGTGYLIKEKQPFTKIDEDVFLLYNDTQSHENGPIENYHIKQGLPLREFERNIESLTHDNLFEHILHKWSESSQDESCLSPTSSDQNLLRQSSNTSSQSQLVDEKNNSISQTVFAHEYKVHPTDKEITVSQNNNTLEVIPFMNDVNNPNLPKEVQGNFSGTTHVFSDGSRRLLINPKQFFHVPENIDNDDTEMFKLERSLAEMDQDLEEHKERMRLNNSNKKNMIKYRKIPQFY